MCRIDLLNRFVLVLLAGTVISGCDKGINPSPESVQTQPVPMGSMAGTIRYQHWPPADSLHDLRLVAFRYYPPGNIINEFLAGNAYAYPAIGQPPLTPFFVDSLFYYFVLPQGVYQYVVVAQQFGPNQLDESNWRAVGQYLDSNLTVPSPVAITHGDTAFYIDINVDFSNPPAPAR